MAYQFFAGEDRFYLLFKITTQRMIAMVKKTVKMNETASRRIQSHADKSGKNQGFKARSMKAASKSKK